MKIFFKGYSKYWLIPKVSLKMKLTTLLLLASLFKIQANAYSQGTKLTLDLKNTSVKEVFHEIESLSEFRFLYESQQIDLDRRLTVKVRKKTISEILPLLFKGENINYKVFNRQIVLTKKKITEPKQIISIEEKTADQQQITGTVIDADGQPLPGANVVEKGTTNGVQTDFDGNFSIGVTNEDAVLVVSYIGFAAKEISIGSQTQISIVLEESTAGLDEVVVVGYGTQRKREITGAISSISAEAISEQVVTGFDQALVGRVAGVQVSQSSGAPGGAVSIRVRGVGTPGNSEPLYVIDGIPVFSDNTGRQGGKTGQGNQPAGALNGINPNDIESIEILKDAASGAIYGSRAANGVVIITTKQGKAGKARFNVDYSIGVQGKEKDLELLDGPTYQEYIRTLNGLNADPSDDNPFTTPSDTDFLDEVFRTSIVQNFNLSASGGNETSKYLVSLGYLDQEGIIRGSDFERFSLRVNTNSKIGNRFRFGNNATISRSLSNQVTENAIFDGAIPLAIIYPSVIPARNEGEDRLGAPGDAGISFIRQNPLVNTDLLSFQAEQFRFLGNVFGEYDVFNGLTYRLNLGADFLYGGSDSFTPNLSFPGTNDTNAGATRFDSREFIWLIEHTLNYKKTIGESHNIDILAGFTTQKSTYSLHSSSKNNFVSNEVPALDAGAEVAGVSGRLVDWSLASFLGRINYNYDSRYFLSASIRRDGSSRFGPGNQWGTFPSVSAGWLVSDEKFFENDIVSSLKLRASWGQLGNQEITPFQYLPLLINTAQYAFGGANVTGIYGAQPANENITWETSTQLDFGVDLSFLNRKITLSVDYFDKETDGILLPGTLPLSFGFLRDRFSQFPTINAGVVSNKGLEFDLGFYDNKGDFKWSVNANLATLENNVVSLGAGGALINVDESVSTRTDVGGPVGAFYGYVVDGIFQNQAEIDAANALSPAGTVYQSSGTSPGDFRFKDLDGNGVVDDADQEILGSPIPDVNYGLTFSANYKNLDFSMSWQGISGNEIYTKIFQQAGDFTKPDNKFAALYNNRWTGEGTSNTVPRIAVDNANNNYRNSSYYVHDGSYLRLRSMQIGYNLPQNVLESLNMSNLRIYVSGQNLVTFDNYEFGLDPEVGATFGQNNLNGVDFGRYPVPRIISIGLNLGF